MKMKSTIIIYCPRHHMPHVTHRLKGIKGYDSQGKGNWAVFRMSWGSHLGFSRELADDFPKN